MHHNNLISEDFAARPTLEKAVALLLAFCAVRTIYFSPQLEEGLDAGIVLVIIQEDSPQAWDELDAGLWKVFEGFPQFSFRIFSAAWVKDELEDGNPFFAVHCVQNHLVYSTTESDEFDFVGKLKPKRFLKKAKQRFERESHAAFIWGTPLRHHVKRQDYLQAAYTLHQNMRWLFIAAESFLTGEWLVAQELETHTRHLGKFSKTLGHAFDADAALLEVLNAACRAVQEGGNTPELSAALLAAAEAKKEWLRLEVHRLFKVCMSRCRYEFSRTKSPLVVLEPDDPLKLVTQIVAETVAISALYCIGQRNEIEGFERVLFETADGDLQTTHYYLFLVVKDFEAHVAGNIAFKIKTRTEGRHTATVIMQSLKSLYKTKGNQQHFFNQVVQRGRLLYQETLKPLPEFDPTERNVAFAKRYWTQRRKTQAFLTEAAILEGEGATNLPVYLLGLAMQQTCLGIIQVFLGYMPGQFSLGYLLELVDYCVPLATERFPRTTEQDKALLKILSSGAMSLRHGDVDSVAQRDYEVLHSRCSAFFARTDVLVAAELERLEQTGNTDFKMTD